MSSFIINGEHTMKDMVRRLVTAGFDAGVKAGSGRHYSGLDNVVDDEYKKMRDSLTIIEKLINSSTEKFTEWIET